MSDPLGQPAPQAEQARLVERAQPAEPEQQAGPVPRVAREHPAQLVLRGKTD